MAVCPKVDNSPIQLPFIKAWGIGATGGGNYYTRANSSAGTSSLWSWNYGLFCLPHFRVRSLGPELFHAGFAPFQMFKTFGRPALWWPWPPPPPPRTQQNMDECPRAQGNWGSSIFSTPSGENLVRRTDFKWLLWNSAPGVLGARARPNFGTLSRACWLEFWAMANQWRLILPTGNILGHCKIRRKWLQFKDYGASYLALGRPQAAGDNAARPLLRRRNSRGSGKRELGRDISRSRFACGICTRLVVLKKATRREVYHYVALQEADIHWCLLSNKDAARGIWETDQRSRTKTFMMYKAVSGTEWIRVCWIDLRLDKNPAATS